MNETAFFMQNMIIFACIKHRIMNLRTKSFCVLVCAFFCMCASMSAKVERTAVYIFGFSASFTDSVAYITDIQRLDSAYIETKSKFLMDRVVYSDQLQTYLEGFKDMKNSTCVVFFNTKKKDLLAEYNKIRKRYEKDGNIILKTTEGEMFRFQSPVYQPRSQSAAVKSDAQKPKKDKKNKKKSKPLASERR